MNRFNLTFSGEIVEGQDPELVKLRFANKFAIDDPARLERFFSGQTVILRRNLERRDAAQVYHELQLLGAVAALVKVPDTDPGEESSHKPPAKTSALDTTRATINRTADRSSRLPQKAAATHAANAPAAPTASGTLPAASADIAAEIKARKLAAQRLAAEKAAREKATLEARQREIAAAAAHEQALAAERQRLADEERAQEIADQARMAEADVARKAAEQAATRQLEAEEAARKTALKAAAKRKAAEEAAERRARRNREKAEKVRRKAEEDARRQAELAEKKRLAAEEEARHQAELEDKKRLAAEEALQKAAAEAEEEARSRAELEAKKRREEAQRKSDERRRIAAEALAVQQLAAQRLTAQQQEALTQHAAAEASPPPLSPVRLQTLKPAKSRVKTTLEVPLRKKGETPEIGVPGHRKRLSGAPNLYKLRPFRNSEAVRTRAALARSRMRQAATTAVLAFGVLLIAAGSYLPNTGNPAMTGTTAMAINANFEPLLLAGDVLLLHDRAGVGTTQIALSALGVSVLKPPLEFAGEDVLFARGRLADDTANSAQHDALQVLRCDLPLSRCTPLAPELQDSHIEAFVLNPLDGSVLLADRTAGQLLKVERGGNVTARANVAIPSEPVMRLHGGLLLINSTAGPGISVFRYEDDAFAKQLDEILPLPRGGVELQEARAGDFLWSGDAWWVYLRPGKSDPGALHRFDEEWNYLNTVKLSAESGPVQPGAVQPGAVQPGAVQLVSWGEKTLVNDAYDPTIQRYNRQGTAEAPFASASLQALVSAQQQRAGLTRAAWHSGLLLCALVVALGCGFAYLHRLRNLVYRPRREQGALPLDDHTGALRWIEPVQNRQLQLRRTGIYYGLAALGALSLGIAVSVSVLQLASLLLVCSGPAVALLLVRRKPIGYLGVLGDQLLLVDHNDLYHLAGGSRLQYCGPFLAIDDIVLFTGSLRLPAFSPAPLQQHVLPLALSGIKVDRKTMAVKLLECRHPLALGAVAIIAAAAAAALLLLVPHIF